jgi:hypothetical protein
MGQKLKESTSYKAGLPLLTWTVFISASHFMALGLAICISPLVLLLDKSMTKASTLPTWTSLASHVCHGDSFPSISHAETVMENAILRVVVKACERGHLVSQDLTILNDAQRYIQENSSPRLTALGELPSTPSPQDTSWRKRTRSWNLTSDLDKRPKVAEKAPTGWRKGRTKRRKGKKSPTVEEEPTGDHEGAPTSEPEEDGCEFVAEFHIPDLQDMGSWPELDVPSHPPSPSPPVPTGVQQKVCEHDMVWWQTCLMDVMQMLQELFLPCASMVDNASYRWVTEKFHFPYYPDSVSPLFRMVIFLPLPTRFPQTPIQKLTWLLGSQALDWTWRPHTLMEAQVLLTMSPEIFQSLVNDHGPLLLVGPPGESRLQRHHLLSLSGKSGQVRCFSESFTC